MERPNREESLVSDGFRQFGGLGGAILLIAGAFGPLVIVPNGRTWTYMTNGDGWLPLFLAALTVVFTCLCRFRPLRFIGLLSLVLPGITYVRIFQLAGSRDRWLGAAIARSELGWAWGAIIFGAVLLMAASRTPPNRTNS